MKRNHKEMLLAICGVLLCISLTILLSAQLLNSSFASSKKLYKEPAERPNIRADAIWDEELGMYVSPEYIREKEQSSILMTDFDEEEYDPETTWLLNHKTSENEIDKAIVKSVELAQKQEPTILSAISPRREDPITSTMRGFSAASYSELWKRICTEPAYRPQKLVAMEFFTGIVFEDLGLYDSLAQHMWFERFNELRPEIIDKDFSSFSSGDIKKYGIFLLPVVYEKCKNQDVTEDDILIINEMISGFEDGFYKGYVSSKIETSIELEEWFDEHADLLDAVNTILKSDYGWSK